MQNNILSIDGGMLTLSSYSKELVKSQYGGIPRIKPADYFGIDHRTISGRYRLNHQGTESVFTRVSKAYQYYWPGRLGRFICYENTQAIEVDEDLQAVYHSLSSINDLKPKDHCEGVSIEAKISCTALYRYLVAFASDVSNIAITSSIEDGSHNFFKVPLAAFPKRHDIQQNRIADQHVWLHRAELENNGIKTGDAISCCVFTGAVTRQLEDVLIEPWEMLSVSVDIAHRARLISELSGAVTKSSLSYASALLAIFAPLISLLKISCRATNIEHSLDTIRFTVDSAYLKETQKVLYDAQMIITSPMSVDRGFARNDNAFDTLFEMHADGEFETIMHADYKALKKGNVL